MTYREFQKYLSRSTEKQLDQDVMVYNSQTRECFPCSGIAQADDDGGVIDAGHLFIEMLCEYK